jgi:hypothetical protein
VVDETDVKEVKEADDEKKPGDTMPDEEVVNDEKNVKAEDKNDHMLALLLRLARVEAAVDKHTQAVLGVAHGAIGAADKIATAAAQQSARVDSAVVDLTTRLTEQVESTFKGAIESGLSDHAASISEKMSTMVDERLHVARSTHESLEALRTEMKMVNKSLSKDIEEEKAVLPRHSIFEGM